MSLFWGQRGQRASSWLSQAQKKLSYGSGNRYWKKMLTFIKSKVVTFVNFMAVATV
jgi:hypothetical protein